MATETGVSEKTPEDHLATIPWWGLDFWRAFNERSRILREIARLAMGKWAFGELIGLREAVDKGGYDTTFFYGMEVCTYHKDFEKLPRWRIHCTCTGQATGEHYEGCVLWRPSPS